MMDESTNKMSSKELLGMLQTQYYADLAVAREQGRKVAWASSIVPQEILETMDVAVCYPENHAAAIAAKGAAMPYIDRAEALGYSNDICSYARINLAYADILKNDAKNEVVNIPRPDFVVCVNNICSVLIKWYECLAKFWDVPYILIDVPYNYDGVVTQDRVDYIKEQLKDFIRQLEEICGKKFDYNKFTQVMKISNRTAHAWSRAMAYAAMKPSPMDGFNMFNYMSMMVCLRGKESSYHLYEAIEREMEAFVAQHKSQYRGEQKYRLMWDGIACWPYLKHNYKTLYKNGIIMVASNYPKTWALTYDVNDMDDMARVYAGIGNNCCVDTQAKNRKEILLENKVDGIVYHINRSCKIMDFAQPEVRRKVYEETHIPYITFDGDQSDPKNFSEAQFETRVQGLVENMDQLKG